MGGGGGGGGDPLSMYFLFVRNKVKFYSDQEFIKNNYFLWSLSNSFSTNFIKR